MRAQTLFIGLAGCLLLALALLAGLSLLPAPVSGAPEAADTTSAWASGGPYAVGQTIPVPVEVVSLDASPAYESDHTLFAAGPDAIFRTRNGGQSWQVVYPAEVGSPEASFALVRVSPAYATDGTVFAVRYEAGSGVAAIDRSLDGGDTWHVHAIVGGPVHALAFSPDFLVDRTVFLLQQDGTRLYKSMDGGVTWVGYPIAAGGALFEASALAVSPNYAADRTLFAAGLGSVHRSRDGGVTWEFLASVGPTYDVALSPGFAGDQTLWATYRAMESPGDGTPESGVLRSGDGGDSFWLPNVGMPGVYEPFSRYLAVSPAFAADSQLFTALSGELLAWPEHNIYRSFDGGNSWVDLGPVPGNLDVHDLVVTTTAREGVRVHVATAAGVWHYVNSCEQRLVNPGFEVDAGWNFPITPYVAGYSTAQVYAGARSLRAGIVEPAVNVRSYSSAQQTVTIPDDVSLATLTLWWYPRSAEGDQAPAVAQESAAVVQMAASGIEAGLAPAGDRQYVLLLDPAGNVLERLWWDRSDRQAWAPLQFDVSAYSGQQVRVHVGVYNDGLNGSTGMFVDEMAMTTCAGGLFTVTRYFPQISKQDGVPPTPVPTPTPTPTPGPGPALVATVELGQRARGVTVDAAGQRAFVAMTGTDGQGVLGVVDLGSYALVRQIPLGPGSASLNDVVLRADERVIFVAERETGTVAAVSLQTGALLRRIPVGSLPNGLLLQSGNLLVANFGGNTLTAVDVSTLAVKRTITGVGAEPSLFAAVQQAPDECCPSGELAYLSAHGSDQVIQLADGQPLTSIPGMTDAYGLAYDPVAQRLYVANRGPAHTVSVVDTRTHAVVQVLDLADKEPYVLAVNPVTGHLFVVCDDEVRVFRTSDGGLVASIGVAAGPDSRIALEPLSGRVLVTGFDGRRLSVIQD